MSYGDDSIRETPKNRGFSGKSALLKSRREDRIALIDSTRCSVCRIPMTDDVKTLWCRVLDCPRTTKRLPTEEEKKQLGMLRGY